TSVEGLSMVTITFTEKASSNSAQDVEREVNSIRDQLPADIKSPVISRLDPNSVPIMQLSLSASSDPTQSSTQTLAELQDVAENTLQKRLEAVDGVAHVNLTGGLEREIQVHVDEHRLESYGLSLLQVNQALAAGNLNAPAGSLDQRGQQWNVRVNTQAQ